MHAFTLLIATMGLASASPISNFLSSRSSAPRDIVASVDRYAGASCTGKICNIAGSGDLVSGCNAVTDDCVASLRLNYANNGCSGTFLLSILFLHTTDANICVNSQGFRRRQLQAGGWVGGIADGGRVQCACW